MARYASRSVSAADGDGDGDREQPSRRLAGDLGGLVQGDLGDLVGAHQAAVEHLQPHVRKAQVDLREAPISSKYISILNCS
jgi:hypothetical protein